MRRYEIVIFFQLLDESLKYTVANGRVGKKIVKYLFSR